jgi:hypothetical protein
MSGRSRPSSVWIVDCSTKSQWATMPASSTTLRSWISPHDPRVSGRFSAVTSSPVSLRRVSVPSVSARTISDSWTCPSRRSRSRRPSSLSTFVSFSCTGPTICLSSSERSAISPAARSSSARRASASRCASESPVWASTSAETDFSSSRRRSRLGLITAAAPAAPRIRPIRSPRSSSTRRSPFEAVVWIQRSRPAKMTRPSDVSRLRPAGRIDAQAARGGVSAS